MAATGLLLLRYCIDFTQLLVCHRQQWDLAVSEFSTQVVLALYCGEGDALLESLGTWESKSSGLFLPKEVRSKFSEYIV